MVVLGHSELTPTNAPSIDAYYDSVVDDLQLNEYPVSS
jgi:hypothetical protein